MGCGGSAQKRYVADENTNAAVEPIASVECEDATATHDTLEQTGNDRSRKNAETALALPIESDRSQRRPTSSLELSTPKIEANHVGVARFVKRLEMKDFTTLQLLDETQTSAIYCLRHHRTGQLFAGKRVFKAAFAADGRGGYEGEALMLNKLAQNPTIVQLRGFFESQSEFWITLELCGGGNLEAWFRRVPSSARDVARQILTAVQGLHEVLVVHLNLHPGNVLLDDNGRVRLCGFATARQLTGPEQRLSGNYGRAGFKAPEVQSGQPYCGFKADVFALGRTLQFAAKYDLSWTKALIPFGEMSSNKPSQRPTLAAVHAEVFSDPGSLPRATLADVRLAELTSQLNGEPWDEDPEVSRVPERRPDVRSRRIGAEAQRPQAKTGLFAPM